jgi:ketosteroid isomerase-like protein
MKKFITITLLLCTCTVFGQEKSIQDEINEQVWIPFIEAFNDRDQDAFRSVHSPEVIRVLRDRERIFGAEVYFRELPDSIQEKRAVWQRDLELQFIERIAQRDKAFEVGYYKTIITHTENGEQMTFYGKFHVLLRKENGQWKILMDADANQNVDEEIFQSANPM